MELKSTTYEFEIGMYTIHATVRTLPDTNDEWSYQFPDEVEELERKRMITEIRKYLKDNEE